ncbi:MAG: hypothetical protein INR71_16230, partial [Terriglobus roseus]|nr:hypothetical protein [Terriglobus roseus]
MPLTVLTDVDVRKVLDTLDKADIQMMHKALADALHNYSTATDDGSGCCAANQPSRIAIKRKDGGATLFMPATSDEAMGVKIVTLAESSASADVNSLASSTRSLSLITSGSSSPGHSRSSSPGPIPRAGTPVSAHASRASTFGSSHHNSSISGASTTTTSASVSTDATTRSSTADEPKPDTITSSGVPIFNPRHAVDLAPPSATSPTGSITLLSRSGQPRAFINAATFTAFRTALASMLLFHIRDNVHTLTVFGAGLQAYWHIHLALLMRGEEIHHLNVINRSFPRAQRMMITLAKHQAIGFGEKMRPSILTPEYGEYTRLLKEHVRNADAIICCTPSTEPLFPPSYLTNPEGRRKARYVAAVGSYKPHMQELHADILRRAVAPHSHGRHNHRHAQDGGAIVVDSIEGALREAGEVINAGIGAHGVVELGE